MSMKDGRRDLTSEEPEVGGVWMNVWRRKTTFRNESEMTRAKTDISD